MSTPFDRLKLFISDLRLKYPTKEVKLFSNLLGRADTNEKIKTKCINAVEGFLKRCVIVPGEDEEFTLDEEAQLSYNKKLKVPVGKYYSRANKFVRSSIFKHLLVLRVSILSDDEARIRLKAVLTEEVERGPLESMGIDSSTGMGKMMGGIIGDVIEKIDIDEEEMEDIDPTEMFKKLMSPDILGTMMSSVQSMMSSGMDIGELMGMMSTAFNGGLSGMGIESLKDEDDFDRQIAELEAEAEKDE